MHKEVKKKKQNKCKRWKSWLKKGIKLLQIVTAPFICKENKIAEKAKNLKKYKLLKYEESQQESPEWAECFDAWVVEIAQKL